MEDKKVKNQELQKQLKDLENKVSEKLKVCKRLDIERKIDKKTADMRRLSLAD